jgi:hypothetical protein
VHLLGGEEAFSKSAPIIGGSMTQREIADRVPVEDASVAMLPHVTVEQFEELREGDGETVLAVPSPSETPSGGSQSMARSNNDSSHGVPSACGKASSAPAAASPIPALPAERY